MYIKTKKKGALMLYEGLKLKVLDKGSLLGYIIVKEVKNNENFISEQEGRPSDLIEFKFLKETNAWHIVFEGLGGEKCVKEELPYTLCPC